MRGPRAWIWRREYTNGGYEERLCRTKAEVEELAEDSRGLPKRDLIIPLYALPPNAETQEEDGLDYYDKWVESTAEIERLREVLTNVREALNGANDTIWMPVSVSLSETAVDHIDAALTGKESK